MNVRGIIRRIAEQLAALQHSRLRLDIGAGIGGGNAPARPGAHRVPADAKLRPVHVRKLGQEPIRRNAAAGAVLHAVARLVLCVMLVEEREVREVHQKPVAHRPADRTERPVFDTVLAVIDLYHVVDVSALLETGLACAVPVFVDREHDHAALTQLDCVRRVGFVIVLVPVQQQHAGRLFAVLQPGRGVELIKEIADLRGQIPFRDRDRAVRLLNAIRKEQRDERSNEQKRQSGRPFSPTFFHINPLLFDRI